eukprot:TRINITY_DN13230_c0_g1_i1.p1 TRINITY_DN13230_c0_g1~~TRINITY_DN13230_c0_g1_i1.p1  ORF type:complete len:393 (-),score=69.25 TRINITY_DN13230_c0_g1_i1:186-1364(-)
MAMRAAAVTAALLQTAGAVRQTRSDEWGEALELEAQGQANATKLTNCPDTIPDIEGRYTGLYRVGSGANGCVYIGKDVEHDNAKIAVKTSKRPGRMKSWQHECGLMQMMHVKACKAGGESLDLVENYIPTCLEVTGTDENPLLIMHATGTTEMASYTRLVKTDGEKKSVFAQLVAAIHALHNVGLTHNDLHAKNVMLQETSATSDLAHIHLALIDFGDVKPFHKRNAAWNRGYKRDSFAIWRMGGNLADCPGAAHLGATKRVLEKREFLECVNRTWTPGIDFMNILNKLVDDTEEGTTGRQHVGELYETAFVQDNLPSDKHYYKLLNNVTCSSRGLQWSDEGDDHETSHHGSSSESQTDTASPCVQVVFARLNLMFMFVLCLLLRAFWSVSN